jgi:hypothetical protein
MVECLLSVIGGLCLVHCECCPVAYRSVAVRLQYKDPDEVSVICSFIRYLQGFYKLPEKDSNLRLLIQSHTRYVCRCRWLFSNRLR